MHSALHVRGRLLDCHATTTPVVIHVVLARQNRSQMMFWQRLMVAQLGHNQASSLQVKSHRLSVIYMLLLNWKVLRWQALKHDASTLDHFDSAVQW